MAQPWSQESAPTGLASPDRWTGSIFLPAALPGLLLAALTLGLPPCSRAAVDLEFLRFATSALGAMQPEGSGEDAGFLIDEVVAAIAEAAETESLLQMTGEAN